MNPTTPDPLEALVEYLTRDAEVADPSVAAGRVFGGELAPAEAATMPRACVLVRYAGGGAGVEGSGYAYVGSCRVDVWSFGATPFEAGRVRLATYRAMKQMNPLRASNGCRLLSAVHVGGPIHLRDPDLEDAPAIIESWQLMAAEQSAA